MPQAQKGVLNLQGWDFSQRPALDLQGEWEFYYKAYLNQQQLKTRKEKSYAPIQKQGNDWKGLRWKGNRIENFGWATYALQIILPAKKPTSLALKVPPPNTCNRIYVNGQLLGQTGTPGTSRASSIPEFKPLLIPLSNLQSDTLSIVLQVANFHHRKGGLSQALILGTQADLQTQTNHEVWRTLFLIGTFFMMGVNHLFLFFLYRKGISSIYFALFCFITLGRSLVLGEMLIKEILPVVSWEWMLRIEYIGFFGNILFASLFAKALFPKEFPHWIIQLIVGINVACLGLVFVTPPRIHSFLFPYVYLIIPILIAALTYAAFRMIRHKVKGGAIYLLGTLIIILTTVNDVMYHSGVINTTDLIFFGVFVYFFSQSFLIAQRFSTAFTRLEDSTNELKGLNETLELRVNNRTQELKQQKDAMKEQNQQLATQAKRIQDSIKVAQNIQNSILPDEHKLGEHLDEYFLMFRPKDMVSGDFYWVSKVEGQTFIVVADCTGHGVPGAMMTMIGKMSLDKIINYQKITDPKAIIHHLNQDINLILEQDRAYNHYGMDLGIFTLQAHNDTDIRVTFSGAKTHLYYISPPYKDFQAIIGSRKSIGGEFMKHLSFKKHEVILPKGTMLYAGSDGLADQNNHRRKRFGTRLLHELLKENAHLHVKKQQEILEEALELHMLKSEQRDDILWLGVRI